MRGSTDLAARLPAGRAGSEDAPPSDARASAIDEPALRALGLLTIGACLLLVALGYRLALLVRFYATPDADQSIVGLMARHILAGERPVFYWGQPYTGSGEAYLTAGLFSAFGQGDLLLHVVPLAASLCFTLLVAGLAWRVYGPGVAALCGLYLALPPALLIDWGFWAGSGYLETMALGTGALLLALPPRAEGRAAGRGWWRVPGAFLLLGLGIWVQPVGLYYLLAVLATLIGPWLAAARAPRRWPGGLARCATSASLFALGMAPLLQFNLQHRWETLAFLTNRATHLDLATVLSRALLWAGPVLAGLAPPTTDRSYFERFLLNHYPLYGLGLGLVWFLLWRGLRLWRQARRRLLTVLAPAPAADLGMLVLLLLVVAAYLSSSWGAESWSGSQPRYLLPVYSALPLLVRAALPLGRGRLRWPAAALVVLGLCACGVYVNGTTFARDDVRPLARMLQDRGITAVYGDYWLVYPLIWVSDERLAGVATKDDLSAGRNRYSPYLRAAAASRHLAWVVRAGSARERAVLACFARLHSRYAALTWRDQRIYDAPTSRAFPWWNGGRC